MTDETIYRLGNSVWAVTVEAERRLQSGLVKFNGFVVGKWDAPADLSPRLELALSDGSILTLRRVRDRAFRRDLDIRRNGIPLAGSARDPRRKVTDAAGFLLFLGTLSALVGLVGLAAAPGADRPTAIGSLVIASVLLGLGFRARKGSILALGAAIGLI